MSSTPYFEGKCWFVILVFVKLFVHSPLCAASFCSHIGRDSNVPEASWLLEQGGSMEINDLFDCVDGFLDGVMAGRSIVWSCFLGC